MKKRYFAVALPLLAYFFSAGCGKEKDTASFSVMTYNIAGLPEPVSGSKPATNTTVIGRLCNTIDIVHVQEDFHYHDSFLLHDRHPYQTPFMGEAFYGDGLNTFSAFPIHGFSRTKWTDCADFDCLTPKGFSYSQIEVAPGMPIDFYNVHTNAQSYEAALVARQKNTRQLCAYIQQHSAGRPVIVMGDMNSRYTRVGDSIRNVLDLGFKDVWVELVRGGNIPAQDGQSLMNCGENGDGRTRYDCEKVDKIFYRSGTDIEISPVTYILDSRRYYYRQNDTLPLSDHWPAFAVFKARRRN